MALSIEAAKRKDLNAKAPTMQHRHFAFIAKMVSELPDSVNRLTVARNFAFHLHNTNPNFDRDRFLAACRPE